MVEAQVFREYRRDRRFRRPARNINTVASDFEGLESIGQPLDRDFHQSGSPRPGNRLVALLDLLVTMITVSPAVHIPGVDGPNVRAAFYVVSLVGFLWGQ